MTKPKSQWCVIHTQPRGEKRAEQNLRLQGYSIFAPFIAKRVRHARRFKSVQIPLFPRYIFVELDMSRDPWRSINGTGGVSKLVTVNDRPVPLPDGLVDALMESDLCNQQTAALAIFRVDEPVLINDGPFADLIGRIERIDDKGRVQVLLEIMGRAVSVRTRTSQLMREPSAPSHQSVHASIR